MAFENTKGNLKYFLMNKSNVLRIHIVGCGRSGTTMLHYSMCAFKNTILFDKETSLWKHPSLSEAFKLFAKNVINPYTCYFVTKRNSGWWKADNIEKIAKFTMKYNVFLINLIRDPRDVLTSRHPLGKKKYYVDIDLWKNVMAASEKLNQYLKGYESYLIIRYEDILLNTEQVKEIIKAKLGMELKTSISSWSRLKDNLDAMNGIGNMVPFLNKLRNFDEKTIGRWKTDRDNYHYIESLLNNRSYNYDLTKFLDRYNYQ